MLMCQDCELENLCSGRTLSKQKGKIEYGVIAVPENRHKPASRVLHLPFIRYRSIQDNSHPPVFLLTGGPGGSNLWVDLPEVFYTHNDLVKIGYRGVDGNVKLKCPEIGTALTITNPLSPQGLAHITQAMREAYDRTRREGVDIDAYNMVEVVNDLDAIREALGYSQVNLFSTSYGTQVAYLYCAKFPEYAHRCLMVGASSRQRQFVYEPAMIEKQLADYNVVWKNDSEAVARSVDIIQTIRHAQASLPPEWNGVVIDRDKLRMVSYYLLYETESAAMLFDAYCAADSGDPGGLAVLCLGWDEDVTNSSRRYWGDFVSKIVSGRARVGSHTVIARDSESAVAISPLSGLWWETALPGGWPILPIPPEYCRLDTISAEVLIANGNLDFSSPPEYIFNEVMPHLKNGRFVVLSNMGHMDVIKLQREAFENMVARFYFDGVVDTSKYLFNKIDFTPAETYQDYAKQLFPKK